MFSQRRGAQVACVTCAEARREHFRGGASVSRSFLSRKGVMSQRKFFYSKIAHEARPEKNRAIALVSGSNGAVGDERREAGKRRALFNLDFNARFISKSGDHQQLR